MTWRAARDLHIGSSFWRVICLEDLNDIKERPVLVLDVEQFGEVKNYIKNKFSGLRELLKSIKTVVTD